MGESVDKPVVPPGQTAAVPPVSHSPRPPHPQLSPPYQSVLSEPEWLALAGFLAGYRCNGLARLAGF